jgi:hypothetical protein
MAKTDTQHFEAVPIVELGREDALEVDIPVAQSIPSFTEDRGTTGLTSASSIPVSLKIYCDISSLVALSFMPTIAFQFTYDHCTVDNG